MPAAPAPARPAPPAIPRDRLPWGCRQSPHAASAASAVAGSSLRRYTVGRFTPAALAIWAMLAVPLASMSRTAANCARLNCRPYRRGQGPDERRGAKNENTLTGRCERGALRGKSASKGRSSATQMSPSGQLRRGCPSRVRFASDRGQIDAPRRTTRRATTGQRSTPTYYLCNQRCARG
jgi:hypothetical protein